VLIEEFESERYKSSVFNLTTFQHCDILRITMENLRVFRILDEVLKGKILSANQK
jgi:hypothetical protein